MTRQTGEKMSDKRYYYARTGEHWEEPGEHSLVEIEPLEDVGGVIAVGSRKTLAGTELHADSVLKSQVFDSVQEAVEIIAPFLEITLGRLGEKMDKIELDLLALRRLK